MFFRKAQIFRTVGLMLILPSKLLIFLLFLDLSRGHCGPPRRRGNIMDLQRRKPVRAYGIDPSVVAMRMFPVFGVRRDRPRLGPHAGRYHRYPVIVDAGFNRNRAPAERAALSGTGSPDRAAGSWCAHKRRQARPAADRSCRCDR